MKHVYLALAILGAVVPYYFFLQFFSSSQPQGFIAALFVNGAAGGFTADLLITSAVFWLFMWSRKGSGPAPWFYIVLNLVIGLSCALPAYLYSCEKRANQI